MKTKLDMQLRNSLSWFSWEPCHISVGDYKDKSGKFSSLLSWSPGRFQSTMVSPIADGSEESYWACWFTSGQLIIPKLHLQGLEAHQFTLTCASERRSWTWAPSHDQTRDEPVHAIMWWLSGGYSGGSSISRPAPVANCLQDLLPFSCRRLWRLNLFLLNSKISNTHFRLRTRSTDLT